MSNLAALVRSSAPDSGRRASASPVGTPPRLPDDSQHLLLSDLVRESDPDASDAILSSLIRDCGIDADTTKQTPIGTPPRKEMENQGQFTGTIRMPSPPQFTSTPIPHLGRPVFETLEGTPMLLLPPYQPGNPAPIHSAPKFGSPAPVTSMHDAVIVAPSTAHTRNRSNEWESVDAWKAFVDEQFHQEATPREDLVYKMAEEIKLYKLKMVAERTAREHAEALWKQDQEAKRQAERQSLERLRTINDHAMRLKKENERLKALLTDSEGVIVGLRGEKADERGGEGGAACAT